MIIKPLEDADRDLYAKYAKEYGTIFNTLEWLSIFGNNVQLYGIYDKGDNFIGGYHLLCVKRFGFTIYSNAPFTSGIGPFLKVEAKKAVNIMDTWKSVLTAMSFSFNRLPYSIISVSLNSKIVDTQPFIWDKFKVVPRYTYIIDLKQSVENIEAQLSKSHRHAVNRASKDGLITKKIDDLQIVADLALKSFERQNKKADEHYLNRILFDFASQDNSCAFATFKGDIPIAATLFVYDKVTGYAIIGGYDHENKHNGAGVATRIEAIKHAKKLGLEYFDFEGSMIPGIENFYRDFGGRLTPYYRINKAKLPIEVLLKFTKRELF